MSDEMDRRGLIFNSAFAVSASFMFIDHLAWTMSVAPETTLAVIVGKMTAGVISVIFAYFMCKIKKIV
jgi:ethanolamine transporter